MINLKIDDYNDKEIEEILSLEYPYGINDIKNNASNLLTNLVADSNVKSDMKQNIESFLNKASERLFKSLTNSNNNSTDNINNFKNSVTNVGEHFIIHNASRREEAKNLSSNYGLNIGDDGGAPPGIINPIRYTTVKRALNIDSRFRPDYYKTSSADQKINLPYKFTNIINMRLASIEIPLTYHSISNHLGNNTFVVAWNYDISDNPANVVEINIPDGNYETFSSSGIESTKIESAINTALQNPNQIVIRGSSIVNDPSFNLIYTVDKTSGRSIFSLDLSSSLIQDIYNDDPEQLRYKIIFGVNTNSLSNLIQLGQYPNEPLPFFLGWYLGFRVNVYDSGTPINSTTPPAAIVSEGICYIKGPQYIFLAIDDYNNNVNNYYISAYADSINNKNILARINLSSIQQSNGFYKTGEDDGFSTQINRSRNYFGPVDIEKLRITLYDEYGRILNLNNMDWSCALMFEQLYEGN